MDSPRDERYSRFHSERTVVLRRETGNALQQVEQRAASRDDRESCRRSRSRHRNRVVTVQECSGLSRAASRDDQESGRRSRSRHHSRVVTFQEHSRRSRARSRSGHGHRGSSDRRVERSHERSRDQRRRSPSARRRERRRHGHSQESRRAVSSTVSSVSDVQPIPVIVSVPVSKTVEDDARALHASSEVMEAVVVSSLSLQVCCSEHC